MKIEKIRNPICLCDFAHGAAIKTAGGRSLGATCDPGEAENIIKTYFQTEFFPEPVHVFFGGEIGQTGLWGYTFSPQYDGTKNSQISLNYSKDFFKN